MEYEQIPKRLYVRRVERELYSYPALRVAMENEMELEKAGLSNLFPSLVPAYGEKVGSSGNISKPTEQYAIKKAEKTMKVQMIERALSALNTQERKLVEEKYFNPSQPSDTQVFTALAMGSTTYYKVKNQVIRKIAISLNII
jgi:ArpU family phage transcriptional regulator